MLRHIVAWDFKEGFSEEENRENALRIKKELEALSGIIDGIVELKVYIDFLPSSNKDIVLNSSFISEKALQDYQIHPEHKKVGEFLAVVLQNKVCVDYFVV